MKARVVRKRFTNQANGQVCRIHTLDSTFGIPKAAMVFVIDNGAQLNAFDTTGTTARNLAVGTLANRFQTGINPFQHFITIGDAGAQTTSIRGNSTSRLFTLSNTARSAYVQGTGTVFYDSGIQFNLTKGTFPGSLTSFDVIAVFFGGTALTAGNGYTALAQTEATDRAVSDFNFQPDAAIVTFTGDLATIDTSTASSAQLSWGAAQRLPSIQQYYAIWNEYTASGSVDVRAGIGSEMVAKRSSASGVALPPTVSGGSGGSIFSFDANGFTMRTTLGTQAAGTYNFGYLLLKDFTSRIRVGNFRSPSGTGRTFIDVGFVPQFVMGASVGSTLFQVQYDTQLEASGLNFWFANGPASNNRYFKGNGTMTCATTGTAVTGTGSSFFDQISHGDILYGPNYETIGTVSSVGSSTSVTLTANASVSLAAGNDYFINNSGQYSIVFGDEQGNGDSTAYSGIMTSAPVYSTSSAGSPSNYMQAATLTFDSRPGFTANYNTVNGSGRLNWYIAFEAEPREARRQSGT
jgi:hypothetical protein